MTSCDGSQACGGLISNCVVLCIADHGLQLFSFQKRVHIVPTTHIILQNQKPYVFKAFY